MAKIIDLFDQLENQSLDNQQLSAGLEAALEVIEQYELDIRNAEETIGINLVEKGFCQGNWYKDAANRLLRKLS